MKKILVVLMLCVVLNVSVEAKTKKEAERPMTEFEQWQKEEKLTYYLRKCKEYYDAAKDEELKLVRDTSLIAQKYKMASKYQEYYENLENSNYYVNLNHHDIGYTRYYYNGGYQFEVFFDLDGKAITLKDGVHLYSKTRNEWKEEEQIALNKGREISRRINEETGYNDRVTEELNKGEDVKEFLNKH